MRRQLIFEISVPGTLAGITATVLCMAMGTVSDILMFSIVLLLEFFLKSMMLNSVELGM